MLCSAPAASSPHSQTQLKTTEEESWAGRHGLRLHKPPATEMELRLRLRPPRRPLRQRLSDLVDALLIDNRPDLQ